MLVGEREKCRDLRDSSETLRICPSREMINNISRTKEPIVYSGIASYTTSGTNHAPDHRTEMFFNYSKLSR